MRWVSKYRLRSSKYRSFCFLETADDMNFKAQGSIIMLLTSAWLRNQNKSIFLCLNPECLFAYLIGCCWDEFQVFCGNKHLEPIMPPSWWHHKNKEILFISMLIASVSLINFCWLVFLEFCRTTHDIYEPIITRMLIAYWHLQNRDISLLLNIDCLFLFH